MVILMAQIRAGIQMNPNVSILLQKWGVADVIGDNLVQIEELSMRQKDGTLVGHTDIPVVEKELGRPWWFVHCAHLHEGLAVVTKRLGAVFHINSRVVSLDYQNGGEVTVQTQKGYTYQFDLCVGADGVSSIVRSTLFPDVRPDAKTTNCAYRAVIPYERIRQDPIAKEIIQKQTMEV